MLRLRWKKLIARENEDVSDLDDEALAQRAQQETELFGELYRRYAKEIERFVHSRVSDPVLAEDIASKVFSKALQALPRYKEGSFRAWLYRIARNTIIGGIACRIQSFSATIHSRRVHRKRHRRRHRWS